MEPVNRVRIPLYFASLCAAFGGIYNNPTIGVALTSFAFVFAIITFFELMVIWNNTLTVGSEAKEDSG